MPGAARTAAGAGALGLAVALAAAAALGPGEEERRRRELAPGAVQRLAPDVRRARAEAAAAFRAGGVRGVAQGRAGVEPGRRDGGGACDGDG